MRTVTFFAGFTAGYLLGAKAGRMRYEQIMGRLQGLLGSSTVHDVTTTVRQQAEGVASTAKRVVTEKLGGEPVGATNGRVDPYPSATI
jgi:hypothetical protein